MARDQVSEIVHARDTAVGFDLHYALLEKTLTDSCPNDGLTVCLGHGNIALNLSFEPSFPHIEIIARHYSVIFDNGIDYTTCEQRTHLVSYQAAEYLSETW